MSLMEDEDSVDIELQVHFCSFVWSVMIYQVDFWYAISHSLLSWIAWCRILSLRYYGI